MVTQKVSINKTKKKKEKHLITLPCGEREREGVSTN